MKRAGAGPGAGRRAVFVRAASRPVPRVTRMMAVAAECGLEPEFCGAPREAGLHRETEWEGYPVRRIGQPFPLLNGRRPLLYLRSITGFNRAVVTHLKERRPALVHASDIESFPGAWAYCRSRGVPLLYNIHDNLGQRYRIPSLLRRVLNGIEGIAVRAATLTLVPEPFRRDALPRWCHSTVRVLRNTPEDPGYSPPPRLGKDRIVFFYGGWIDVGRGLRVLLELLDLLPEAVLRFAGEGDQRLIEELEAHPRVTFLGFRAHDEVLAETAKCHFVPVLYDPSKPINRYAASNKLAEALAVGRPLIINRELKVYESIRHAHCVLGAAYGDTVTWSRQIQQLAHERTRHIEACESARMLYLAQYHDEGARESAGRMLREVLGANRDPRVDAWLPTEG